MNWAQFGLWLEECDTHTGQAAGRPALDFPDCHWQWWYEHGLTPLQACERALRAAGYRDHNGNLAPYADGDAGTEPTLSPTDAREGTS